MLKNINFYDKLKIAVILILQFFIFYFWQTSIIEGGITIFNLLGANNGWILPIAVLIFILTNLLLALWFFAKNYFLKTFLFLFNFFLVLLELIIVGYYLITV
ncbi:MAG: hypothetical protein PHW50_00130 [Patescibacteria group bacterium]|nr:hypothetical protein [Patescibacteria group bacterium]